MYDVSGRCVFEEKQGILNKGLHHLRIGLGQIASGIYILKASFDRKNSFIKCVVLK
jgi:hypothetical protein